MQFELLTGKHSENGKVYTAGQSVSSFRNLVDIFPHKFRLISDGGESQFDGLSPAPAKVLKHGSDVSTIVDHRISKSNIKVYHRAGWYTIDDKEDNVLNEEKLRRSELTPFLDEYFNEPKKVDTESDAVEE